MFAHVWLLPSSHCLPRHEGVQVLPNGSKRTRGLPLSEKLLPGERWQEAAVRGVLEELGPVLTADPQVGRAMVGWVHRSLMPSCC